MNMFARRKDSTKLQEQLQQLQGSGVNYVDPNEWKITRDKDGNGTAVFRFLPAASGDDLPFVKVYNHYIKKGTRFYSELCPTSIDAKGFDNCPACLANREAWEKSEEEGKNSGYNRQLSYWANILIIDDPDVPENNGKVFKFRFGKTIFDMIAEKATGNPKIKEEPVDVTDPFTGCDFVFNCTKKKTGTAEFPNYDSSKFKNPSEIENIDDPEKQQYIMEHMHDLKEVISPDKFKPVEELNEKFNALFAGNTHYSGSNSSSSGNENSFDNQLKSYAANKTESKESNESKADKLLNDAKNETAKFDVDFDNIFND